MQNINLSPGYFRGFIPQHWTPKPGTVNMPHFNPAVGHMNGQMFPIAPANPTGMPGSGMPAAQTNTYPGKSMGLSLDQAQILATSATKSKGYRHGLLSGTNNLFNGLQISGTAGLLLGITTMLVQQIPTPANAPESITFTINNYAVLNSTSFNFLNKQFMTSAFYFPVNQPLSGQDAISIAYNNVTVSQSVDIVFWYL